MRYLWMAILLFAAVALATCIEPSFRAWSRRTEPPQSLQEAVLGESRRLFANHFFIQSDIYLHSGYYPGIFDQQPPPEDPPGTEHKEEKHDFLGPSRNWLDTFGRNFFPSRHSHLEAGDTGQAREILPWIKLSAEMDPGRVETFTVGAYWLRTMGKNAEALQFLRQGLRANPDSYEILFELGCCYEESRDVERARNLWELALQKWQLQEAGKEEMNRLAVAQILTHLARLESQQNNRDATLRHLELLERYSVVPGEIRRRIEEVRAGKGYGF